MPLSDDGCIIRAVGFVAIYSAYLEDDLANLVNIAKIFISFKKEIEQFRLGDQAKLLRKELNIYYLNILSFLSKDNEQQRVNLILKNVEKIAKKRNHILHSPIIAQHDGDAQHDRKTQSKTKINSAIIYQVANEIDALCGAIIGLESCLYKLALNLLTT